MYNNQALRHLESNPIRLCLSQGTHIAECIICEGRVPTGGSFVHVGQGRQICVDCSLTIGKLTKTLPEPVFEQSRVSFYLNVEEYEIPYRVRVNHERTMFEVRRLREEIWHRTTKEFFEWLLTKGFTLYATETDLRPTGFSVYYEPSAYWKETDKTPDEN